MPAAPAYEQQPLALPRGGPAGLQVFALRLLSVEPVVPPSVQRQALRSAVDHAVQATLGLGAGDLQHVPGKSPHWPLHPDWRGSIAYAWPLALWGMGLNGAWGVDVEIVPTTDGHAQHYQDVAALYLEPEAQAHINSGADFAAQWCALEAQLKCVGLPLGEAASRPHGWNASLDTAWLDVPPGWGDYRAALAWQL